MLKGRNHFCRTSSTSSKAVTAQRLIGNFTVCICSNGFSTVKTCVTDSVLHTKLFHDERERIFPCWIGRPSIGCDVWSFLPGFNCYCSILNIRINWLNLLCKGLVTHACKWGIHFPVIEFVSTVIRLVTVWKYNQILKSNGF